jgi:hypothetical protein
MFRHKLIRFFPVGFLMLLASQVLRHHMHGRKLIFAEHFLIGVSIALIVFGLSWRWTKVSR